MDRFSSPKQPLLLCIVTIMSLSCARQVLLCHGRKHVPAFLPSARSGSCHLQKCAPNIKRRTPAVRHQSKLLSTRSSDAAKQSEEYDLDGILPFEKHSHNSIKITVPDEQSQDNDSFDDTSFHSKLEATIATAQQLHKSAIWITIPISKSRLIEHAHQSGFIFHHAEGSSATLSKWLLPEESRIPTFATHQVGVGAVCINKLTIEILCVREKRNNYRPWKMPGGLAELGEHLDEAVVREVYEETGIQTKFLSVLGVRHTHGLQFGRSDLYFVCRLEPIPDENGVCGKPVPQEGEIEAAAWVCLDEYRDMVNDPDERVSHPMMRQIMRLVDQGVENELDIQRTVVSSVVPGRKGSPVYHAALRDE